MPGCQVAPPFFSVVASSVADKPRAMREPMVRAISPDAGAMGPIDAIGQQLSAFVVLTFFSRKIQSVQPAPAAAHAAQHAPMSATTRPLGALAARLPPSCWTLCRSRAPATQVGVGAGAPADLCTSVSWAVVTVSASPPFF